MTPAPLQVGQAPSELALNRAGFTPLTLANALRIGSSSPVYVAGLLRLSRGSRPGRPTPLLACRDRAVHERALPGAGDAGDDGEHPERDVDVDALQVVRPRAADLQRAGGLAHRLLDGGPVVEMAAGDGATGPQSLDGAFEADGAARRTGAGAEVDDMVGDRDRLRLVLHDEHRVALVPQPQQQVVHPLDVMRVQADGGLVEDVGDVGERGAEVADHLDALRLAAGQRARRPVEREVAEPDLHERVEGLLQRGEQRRHRRLVETADPLGQVADLHRAGVGDADPLDLRRPGPSLSRVPSHSGQVVKVTARSTNSRMCGCMPSRSLASMDLWIRGISPRRSC